MKKYLVNLLISIVTLFFCFFTAEIYFRYFYSESDGLGITLAHKKWGDKYWKPMNSLGFRDKEWSNKDLVGKKVIEVIGDSFVAGHGIKNIGDRFPDILAKKLGSEFAILNISNPGWGTKTELFVFKYFPLMPDYVIWSYFPNDILGVARKYGRSPPYEVTIPKGLLGNIINSSYFLNYCYWNIFRITKLSDEYSKWLQELYADPAIWNVHKEELELVCELAKSKKTKLIVILFPFLTKKVKSDLILDKVKEIFKNNNVPVLDVSTIINNLKEHELTVSKIDAHPSIIVHKLVSESLYDIVLNPIKE